jgi:hypothetical protein
LAAIPSFLLLAAILIPYQNCKFLFLLLDVEGRKGEWGRGFLLPAEEGKWLM